MEMLSGAAVLFAAALVTGQITGFVPGQVSLKSQLALLYLIVVSGILGFSAYIFLLRTQSPARATSYGFVHPVVAVFLGWALADEAITLRTVVGAIVILSSVALITIYRAQNQPRQMTATTTGLAQNKVSNTAPQVTIDIP
jgi:drug/metabolite transporter (DMT)-like permease